MLCLSDIPPIAEFGGIPQAGSACQTTQVLYNNFSADLTSQLAGAQLIDLVILLKTRLKRAVFLPLSNLRLL